ncbi:fumarate hydratase [Anaeropeptidivorans aminofermentans]|jgi:fumarate hydratase subunit alpha|uniref:fumarate hydratase n=1 Tax=Anaeropeptidivorans aminofermentans TaxID=2934315 RepID=UPI002024F315|nr:fumarate hydratase [Anaeropeptidivorans aminofermentans]MBE6011740.1 fumarate hydratase [Lachnospiraceae bacterium]
MREIDVSQVKETIAKLCIDANYYISKDILSCFKKGVKEETKPIAKDILGILIDNAEIAETEGIAICQDTGMAVVFVEVGQDVHFTGGNLYDAINEGVAKGYEEGYLRKSVVKDPINRVNTKDNTPAVIHTFIVPGDKVKLTVSPKGFGSENMSRLVMLKPSQGLEAVKKFIIETVKIAGPNACPPVIVGVGVGGTMEKAALMSKMALLRTVDSKNPDEFWASVEEELLEEINKLDIGPGGFGGINTALGVNIEAYPTHIAGLPVAVNMGCHVTRHAEAVL